MAFEPGIDIGNPTVTFDEGAYVSDSTKAFYPLTHVLTLDPIEYTEGSYVSSTGKVFYPLTLELEQLLLAHGIPYVRVYPDKVYYETEVVRIFALPYQPGDDGLEIVFDVQRPLVAGFDAEPMSGDAPLRVQFTDTSEGGPTGWLWVFGDGTTSTLQNPLHEFEFPGLYPVTLTVSGPNQRKDSTGKVIYVRFPLGMGGGILMVPINIMKCLAFGAVNSPGGPKDGLKTFLRMFNRSDYTDQVLE